MRIRPPELETSICDAKYHVSLVGNIVMFCSMQIDSDLLPSFGLSKWLPFVEWISPRYWLYLLVLTTRNVIETLLDRRLTLTRMDTQLNVLSTRRGFWEVRLPKSQQGSNRGFPLLRGKTVILHWGSEKRFFRSWRSVLETESIAVRLPRFVARLGRAGRAPLAARWPMFDACWRYGTTVGGRSAAAGRRCCALAAQASRRWLRALACGVARCRRVFVVGAPPPARRRSGDIVTAGLISSRVWFGPVPGSP
ncbi:hypothetical protein F511_19095 [Dorcoceras hygrometricum]|uniref:Uncharacterized protein n=1 Tax=Dorcoceras hygrometricum TaxID=472368 RepID=A0A2Z7ARD8_9LAMI|nr:hypothetical protein F511_19095 [Dorcoceras hygrometricum]